MKTLKNVFVILLAMLILVSQTGIYTVLAAEDTNPPELVYVEVLNSSVKAGNDIKVKIRVKESQTGLTDILIQFNYSDNGDVAAHYTKKLDKPLFSSGKSYIDYTITVPISSDVRNGDWFIGILEFNDQKGNFSRYCGNKENNLMYSEFITPQQTLTGKTHITVSGSTGDSNGPIINSIKLVNNVIEKPGKLQIEADITEPSGIMRIQINMSSAKDEFIYEVNDFTCVDGKNKYLLNIPISQKRHLGNWEITDIYIVDEKNNDGHYTSYLDEGYFVNYDDKNAKKFPLLKFTVTGIKGDETAPIVNKLQVLNENKTVEKPGVLKLELDLTENESGVCCIEIEYKKPVKNGDFDVNSNAIYRICTQGYEDSSSVTSSHFSLNEPLITGKHELEIPVSSTSPSGNYEVLVRRIVDTAENGAHYLYNNTSYDIFKVEDEFDYCFEMSISNKDLHNSVKEMKDGEVGRILLSGKAKNNILKKQVLNEIAGKNKTLVCYRNGYQWIFSGENIDKNKTRDLNLTARIFSIDGKNLSSGKKAVCISFENNGQLPGKVEFRFKTAFVKNLFGREDKLQLYHVENTKGGYETDIDYKKSDYKKISSKKANFKVVLDDSDSWCYVDITHNSKYVVSTEKLTKLTTLGTTSKITATKTSSSVTLKWNKVTGATGYRVYQKVNGSWKALAYTTNLTYTIKSLKSNTKYDFAVRAYVLNGKTKVLAPKYKSVSATTSKAGLGTTSKITATKTSSSVTLNWNKVTGATGYRVYQKTSSGWKTLANTTKLTYTIKSLKANTSYSFAIRAYVTKSGKTTLAPKYKSLSVTTTKASTKPGQVKNVKATPTATTVKLTWSKVSGVKGYYVFSYNSKTKKYTSLGKTTGTSYTVKKRKANTTYQYAVQAYKVSGGKNVYGKVSSVVKVTTKLATPTLKVTSTKGKANLSWNNIAGESGYAIYMATAKNGKYTHLSNYKANSTKATKSKLKSGKTYYFKIRAYKTVSGKKTYSAYSAVKSVKIK